MSLIMRDNSSKVLAVARYLLSLANDEPEPELVSHLRLQKLVYYVQAWSLAWRGSPMFPNRIEAWQHGPVVRDLYPHFAEFKNASIPAPESPTPDDLHDDERELIEWVWRTYRGESAAALRKRTHSEPPFQQAWARRSSPDRCDEEISQDSLLDYFRTRLQARTPEGFEPQSLQQALQDLREGRGIRLADLLRELDGERRDAV